MICETSCLAVDQVLFLDHSCGMALTGIEKKSKYISTFFQFQLAPFSPHDQTGLIVFYFVFSWNNRNPLKSNFDRGCKLLNWCCTRSMVNCGIRRKKMAAGRLNTSESKKLERLQLPCFDLFYYPIADLYLHTACH